MEYTNEQNKKDRDRFRLLLEYDFYIGEEEEEYKPEGELVTEEPPELDNQDSETESNPEDEGFGIEGDEEIDIDDNEDGFGSDDNEDGFGSDEDEFDIEDDEEVIDEPLPEPEPMEDEVELDITELVQGTEEAKASSDMANQQINKLMSKFDNLNASLERMASMGDKIDNLEHEFEKRNPTPTEKLEMRSLNSFPYSLKLTDYWAEKEGNYDMMDIKKNDKEEYILTQDEVERDYNPIHIKDSFNAPDEKKGFNTF